MDDFAIISQIKNGNIQAYKILVLRYQKQIHKYLHSFGIRQTIIEEIAQETFIRAFKNLNEYDSKKASFSTWLFVIAKNLGINEINRHSYFKEEMPDELPIIIADDTPLSLLEKKELSIHINNRIQLIPLQYRNALVLFHMNEMSIEEISQIEGCSVGTIKSRIFRAKELLKDAFKESNKESL